MEYTDDHYNTHELGGLIHHSGVLTERDFDLCLQNRELMVDGNIGTPQTTVSKASRVSIRRAGYSVIDGGGNGRLQLLGDNAIGGAPVRQKVRVHAGYHKCLSEYSKKVYRRTCKSWLLPEASFRHYYHRADVFYSDCANQTIASISGQGLDLDRFADIKVVRFIRDPRDLLVSGYFYHKRGAEHWCALENPTDIDWKMVNGAVPDALPPNTSLTAYLNQIPLEDGLLAELEFRRFHYDSMLAWPESDPRVRLFRYEDILGNETAVYNSIFDFFGFSLPVRLVGKHYAKKFRAGARSSNKKHIRNPSSGQWRQYFTPKVHQLFNERYSRLLVRYGYALK